MSSSSSFFVSLLVSLLLFYFVIFTNGVEHKIGIRNEYRSKISASLNKKYFFDLGSSSYYSIKSGKTEFWKRFRAWDGYVFTIKVNGRKEKQSVSVTFREVCYCVCSDASIKRGNCYRFPTGKGIGINCPACRPKKKFSRKKIKRTSVRRRFMVKPKRVCGNSMQKYLGKANSPGSCYNKCKKYDNSCSFFYWSNKPQRKNKCYWVGDCKTPKKNPYFDVYTYGPPYLNVKQRYRRSICGGRHIKLGKFKTFGECKNRCAKKNGCKYFIYGNSGPQKGKCDWEKTTKCKPIQNNRYDIYEIWRKDSISKPSDFEDVQTDIVDDNDDDNADDVDIDIDVDIDPDNDNNDDNYDDYKGAVIDMDENINELFDDIDKDENDHEIFVDNYRDIFMFGSVILVILLLMYYLINKCKIINKVSNESPVVIDEITPMIAKQ